MLQRQAQQFDESDRAHVFACSLSLSLSLSLTGYLSEIALCVLIFQFKIMHVF